MIYGSGKISALKQWTGIKEKKITHWLSTITRNREKGGRVVGRNSWDFAMCVGSNACNAGTRKEGVETKKNPLLLSFLHQQHAEPYGKFVPAQTTQRNEHYKLNLQQNN